MAKGQCRVMVRSSKIKIEGVKTLKKFVKASGIFAAAGFPLDLASKIKTDARLARHFQGFSEVEIDTFDSFLTNGTYVATTYLAGWHSIIILSSTVVNQSTNFNWKG